MTSRVRKIAGIAHAFDIPGRRDDPSSIHAAVTFMDAREVTRDRLYGEVRGVFVGVRPARSLRHFHGRQTTDHISPTSPPFSHSVLFINYLGIPAPHVQSIQARALRNPSAGSFHTVFVPTSSSLVMVVPGPMGVTSLLWATVRQRFSFLPALLSST